MNFNKQTRLVSQLGEFAFIDQVIRKLPCAQVKKGSGILSLSKGIGDDAAVLKLNNQKFLLLTKDLLLENVHFLRGNDFCSSKQLGRKSVAVNLSDIAAMGGTPKYLLLGMGLPGQVSLKEMKSFLAGVSELCCQYGVKLIGGDIIKSPKYLFSLTVLGISDGQPLLRSTCREGDELWVTGSLGGGALGLLALKKGKKEGARFIKKHLEPIPRVKEGALLRNSKMLSSMIDISDGLYSDLRRLRGESKVGFKIFTKNLPKMKGFYDLCIKWGQNPLELLVNSGEELELLFTVKRHKASAFRKWISRKNVQATFIGQSQAYAQEIVFEDERGEMLDLNLHVHHF